MKYAGSICAIHDPRNAVKDGDEHTSVVRRFMGGGGWILLCLFSASRRGLTGTRGGKERPAERCRESESNRGTCVVLTRFFQSESGILEIRRMISRLCSGIGKSGNYRIFCVVGAERDRCGWSTPFYAIPPPPPPPPSTPSPLPPLRLGFPMHAALVYLLPNIRFVCH